MSSKTFRRFRRHIPASTETALRKEIRQEQPFFGSTTHETFFQPNASIQRKCEKCEDEEKKVNRMTEKKEEEKKVQRQPEKKEEEKKVMKKENGTTVNPVSGNYISTLSGGQSLPKDVNQFYGSRMGRDFSDVKIHNDKEAAQSAQDINARAYTIGNHIVFNDSQLNYETYGGKKLLAHELAHVVQQNQNAISKNAIYRKVDYDSKGSFVYDIDVTEQILNLINGSFSFLGDTQMVINGTPIDTGKPYTGKDNPLNKPSTSSEFDASTKKFKCMFSSVPLNKMTFLIHLPKKIKWQKNIDLTKLAPMDESIKNNHGNYFFKKCKNKTIDFNVEAEADVLKKLLTHENVHGQHVKQIYNELLVPWDKEMQSRIKKPNVSGTKENCELTLYAGTDDIDTLIGNMLTAMDTKGKDFHKTPSGVEINLKSIKEISCTKLVVIIGYP